MAAGHVTLKVAITPETIALNDARSFFEWAVEALGENVPEPAKRADLAAYLRSRCLPGFGIAQACGALESGDASRARAFFPKHRKPVDWLAVALLCVAEQALVEVAGDRDDKAHWWRSMRTIEQIKGSVGAWLSAREAIRDRQKKASRAAHASGDHFRALVLESFDGRTWQSYAEAARVLWIEHYTRDMPWRDIEALRRFLSRERHGVLTSKPGRPKK